MEIVAKGKKSYYNILPRKQNRLARFIFIKNKMYHLW